jgi:hypothetical protein
MATIDTTQFSGGTYDRLDKESQELTALSWEQYPSPAVSEFIEAMGGINPLLGEELETHGVNYLVIAAGGQNPYSGFEYSSISCVTGEWDANIPTSQGDKWRQILEDNADAVSSAREEFEEAIEQEVKALMGD